ncbi:MAG TPA: heme o synthase [Acidimicrobiales bacterium]|jgi:protoheme IX farnesyltransferase|nr:heme o synthase [Acidimicrobiales bacterium]
MAVARGHSLGRRVGGFVALTKPRIIELLLITTLPTMVVADRRIPSVLLMLATLAGGALSAGGANAANMFIDRDIDAIMKRTSKRPLVTGVVAPAEALVFSIALEVAAFALLWGAVNLLSALLALAAALFYVFVYSLVLKRRSSQNIVIGGAAGAVPVLIGWTAVTDRLAWAPVVLFALIVIWTPSHFWALAVKYRDDYSAAHVPMLPSVASFERVAREIIIYSVALVAVSVVFAFVAHMGVIYWVIAVAGGALYVAYAVRLRSAGSREADHSGATAKAALRLFKFSISYLTLIFLGMAVDILVHVH